MSEPPVASIFVAGAAARSRHPWWVRETCVPPGGTKDMRRPEKGTGAGPLVGPDEQEDNNDRGERPFPQRTPSDLEAARQIQ